MSDTPLAPAPDRFERVHLMEVHARRKLVMPDEWRAYRWEAKSADVLVVTGCIVTATYTRGPRKGRPNFDKRDKATDLPVVITRTEHAAFCQAWEAETGRCHACQGNGTECYGWSKAAGSRYRDCKRCNATGNAPAALRREDVSHDL